MRLHSSCVLFIVIFFICSCAPLPHYFKDKTYLPGQNKGLLVCSVKKEKRGRGSISPSYYIREVGSEEKIRIALHGISVPETQVEEGKLAKIVIFELPAGDYELFHWNLFYNYGLLQYDRQPKEEFSISFSMKPDSVNYIGELTINDLVLGIVDRSRRDIKIAAESEPSIAALPVFKNEMPCRSGCSRSVRTKNEFFYLPVAR